MQKKLLLAHLALLPWLGCPCHLVSQSSAVLATHLTRIDNPAQHCLPSAAVSASQTLKASAASESAGNYIVPLPQPTKKPSTVQPFSTAALSLRLGTLGPGLDVATPLSPGFNLRVGGNFLNFGYGFHLDKMQYQPRLYLRSGQVNLDWFPRHGGFHISPGLMLQQNHLSAVTTAPPGTYFELGSEGFISSLTDPVHGTASASFPNRIAPVLTIGFGNMIPRSGRHLSFPIEIGIAYTGAAQIHLALNGTACSSRGCFAFFQNTEAQASLQQEIQRINENLKRLPLYPIFSFGPALRF